MTENEFKAEITRLSAAFERVPFNRTRLDVFWRLVHDLPVSFFRRQVDKMILELRITDFSEAAAAERRAIASYQRLRELGAREDFERGPDKMREILNKLGCKTIDEALRRQHERRIDQREHGFRTNKT